MCYNDTERHSHHISFVIVYIFFNALWSHPSDRYSLIACLVLSAAVVVTDMHILGQSKVSYFDCPIKIYSIYNSQ